MNEAKNEQEKKDLAMIIEEVFKQRIQGVKNEVGAWITPAFPKLIYTLEEDNCKEGTKYWWLTELAAKCTAKRMVPDYISEKKMLEMKGNCFSSMGCRSFLSPWHDELDVKSVKHAEHDSHESHVGEDFNFEDLWNQLIEQGYKPENNKIVLKKDVYVNHKILNGTIQKCKVEYLIKDSEINEITAHIRTKDLFYGRFNQGVVTVNLPYIALLAYRNIQPKHDVQKKLTDQQRKDQLEEFWKVFDQYLGIAHKALQARHSRLLNTPVETSPLHWMYGGIARLEKGETINKLLFGGYSTISLGYAGLYECIQALTGKSHTDPEANKLAMDIMQHLNDCCEKWKKEENIGYSVYGSPKPFVGH